MSQKLTAGIPPDLDLPESFVIQITAVDPSTGAVVSAVKASNLAIMANPVPADTTVAGPTPAIPLWLPVPVDNQGS